MAEAPSPCAALVRRVDFDRYLAALFAPAEARERLFALYAFNHEIARVRETVSEPMIGQIRLQWWREALDGIYAGSRRKHAVAEALAAAVAAAPAARADFEALIDAREFDLAGRAPATLAELEAYCDGTSGRLLRLAAALLGADPEREQAALADAGVAWALTGLVRAIPFHARARRRYIPDDVAAEAGLGEEALFALRPGAALGRAARLLAAAAERRLDRLRPALGRARPLMLFAPLARAYLRRLARRNHDVLGPPIEIGAARKIALLWWASQTGAR